jgi:glutamine synthetase
MTPREVLDFVKKNKVEMVDLKFVDLVGTWQHFSIPTSELNLDLFKDGSGFDGSSIRGWKAIQNSDMLVFPDPNSARMDPFTELPTLSMVCNVQDPITRAVYERDPRGVAQRAEQYLKSTRIGDVSYWGPEAEFFVFDHASYDQTSNSSYYFIDSDEGIWNSGDDGHNLGARPRHKEGYFPVPPTDTQQDIRTEMVREMEKAGIHVEKHHHEVATGGQAEIDLRFDGLLNMADKMMMYKYIVKNVAHKHGKTATFMPKPLFEDNGTGMHTHQSIWKGDDPLFAGSGYAGLSEMALHYIGGILKHADALIALTNPTTNSFKRLVPGYEAPVNLAYSQRNRSAAVRIPVYSQSPKAKRVEFRCPDPSANPYLAFAAMLMAGLDGIQNKIDPGEPLDKNLYDLEPEEAASIPQTPGSLSDALDALEADHDFLLKGDVFTEDVIETWIEYKRENEVDAINQRPHPHEFALYFDV